MRFEPSGIDGGWIVELDRIQDERGWFARAWCADEFAAHGLPAEFPQANMSSCARAGTLRGLHLQLPPHQEAKALRCVRGSVLDVAVDLRPGSPTYMATAAVVLDDHADQMVFVPEGCAHGYQALTDGCTVHYMTSTPYSPGAERGLRWDDPVVGDVWRDGLDPIVSDKDQSWPTFDDAAWREDVERSTTERSAG